MAQKHMMDNLKPITIKLDQKEMWALNHAVLKHRDTSYVTTSSARLLNISILHDITIYINRRCFTGGKSLKLKPHSAVVLQNHLMSFRYFLDGFELNLINQIINQIDQHYK